LESSAQGIRAVKSAWWRWVRHRWRSSR